MIQHKYNTLKYATQLRYPLSTACVSQKVQQDLLTGMCVEGPESEYSQSRYDLKALYNQGCMRRDKLCSEV